MIRITADLIPFGFEEKKTIIGSCEIINDGTGTREIGNYTLEIKTTLGNNSMSNLIRITNFKRLEKDVWELLYRGLKEIYE